jgi:class 3 adenylate cyclase
MTPDAVRPDTLRLYEEAELRAERLVAILRVGIALGLAVMFSIAVIGASPGPEPVLERQWLFAVMTMGAYFALGVLSLWANDKGYYRPWMAWLAASGDCAFLLVNVWLSLMNTSLPGGYLPTYPPVWLAPVVLAFGALRFNPRLQVYITIVLAAGLVALAIVNQPGTGRPGVPSPQMLQFFFSPPPNLMRLSMFVLAGIVLVIASLRTRHLLDEAIRETRRRVIGDAALVIFGLGGQRERAAAASLACANALLVQFEDWSGDRAGAGEPPVSCGVGIHQGEVFCGVIGEADRLEFTVLGDTVNVAERLQELTKEVGHPIVVSRDVLSAAGLAAAGYQSLGKVALRGRSRSLDAYCYGASYCDV